MSCGLAGSGIRRGSLPPVEVTVGMDGLRFITVVTDDANCWRPIHYSDGALCSTGSLLSMDRYYIGWLELPNLEAAPQRTRPHYQRLFTIRLPS
ncbi:MAG: hypothetical protein SH847_03565 [Roseiflexaceae bacterium]|nr:hypothetical protein [Roseiflexaceae bacterium]